MRCISINQYRMPLDLRILPNTQIMPSCHAPPHSKLIMVAILSNIAMHVPTKQPLYCVTEKLLIPTRPHVINI